MSIVVAQVPAVWDVEANLRTVRGVVAEAQAGDVVVLPEGMLTGYGEDLTPLDGLEPATVFHAVAQVARLAEREQVHIFCGALLPADGGWSNAALFFPAQGACQVYQKINLATNERGRLRPGSRLPTV